MAVKYQAYPEYKDSGVEWLNKLPVGWVSTTIKYGYEVTLGKMLQKERKSFDDQLKPYLKAINIQEYGVDVSQVEKMWFSPLELDSLGLTDGDVLISEGGDVGRSAIWREELPECYIQNAINRARPKRNQSSSFLFYWMYMLKHSGYVEIICNKATIAHYTVDKLENSPLFIPSDSEAEKIADFLDHETAKIDSLIEKQQQLITLLKEKRQAVISHAVTKGLNPDAPMRDSGVEWLGEVPEHWDLPKIKWFYKTESGGTPNTSNYEVYYQNGTVPWIRTTDLNNRDLYETPVSITERAVADTACSILPVNSVLVAMYGGAGTIGKHSLLKFESTINQAVCAILPIKKIDPEFMHLYIEFYRPYWMVGAEGTRKDPNINQEVIRELIQPCPPYDEQTEIVRVTKQQMSVVDEIITKSESNIQLMQERRAALISAAVTGKIDVRNWPVGCG